jgi:hypothetical protein
MPFGPARFLPGKHPNELVQQARALMEHLQDQFSEKSVGPGKPGPSELPGVVLVECLVHETGAAMRPLQRGEELADLRVICAGEALDNEAQRLDQLGVLLGLVVASLAFGAAHLISLTYAILAAFVGAYLGLLWIWTGNLLTPMVTHAAYGFVALVYILRGYRSR